MALARILRNEFTIPFITYTKMVEFNIPTYLTLLRIALIPLLVIFFYLPVNYSNILCTVTFMFAGFTDWLDGYLAREMNLETQFGAFLDPVADKLMVAVILVLLVQSEANAWIAIASAVIIGREITITSLREWMAEIGQRNKVAVSNLGKWKTTLQMTAITCLLYNQDLFNIPVRDIGYITLYISAILTIWSMVSYLKIALSNE